MPNNCIDTELLDVFMKCFELLCINLRINLRTGLSLLKLVIVQGFAGREHGKFGLRIVWTGGREGHSMGNVQYLLRKEVKVFMLILVNEVSNLFPLVYLL